MPPRLVLWSVFSADSHRNIDENALGTTTGPPPSLIFFVYSSSLHLLGMFKEVHAIFKQRYISSSDVNKHSPCCMCNSRVCVSGPVIDSLRCALRRRQMITTSFPILELAEKRSRFLSWDELENDIVDRVKSFLEMVVG